MQKWTYAIVGAVLVAGLLGAGVRESEPAGRMPLVKFHVQTAHCLVAGTSRPIRLKMVCA